jgi:sulfane dehydrogenase subunit SoxC
MAALHAAGEPPMRRSSSPSSSTPRQPDRRRFLKGGAAFGAALVAGAPRPASAQPAPEDPSKVLGRHMVPYTERSRFEQAAKKKGPPTMPDEWGANFTPLGESLGIITASSLHFEVNRGGVPDIDPGKHRLLIHGMIDRPVILTIDEIKRLPSVSRVHFLECAGNTQTEWAAPTGPTAQWTHGLTSCSEWTGVPLSLLLREVGVQKGAAWIIAEGGDGTGNERSLPMAKAMQDILVAYGQNGEALRPENGYPLRLIVPGWEGNVNVKWLRRLTVTDRPYMTRIEAVDHTGLLPGGKARHFMLVMEAKSVITSPSGGQQLRGPGRYEITGLAWSGRGRVRRVEVSTDGGKMWGHANLQEPILPFAHTRFRYPWRWDGRDAVLASRCTDETGYVQPMLAALVKVRGLNSRFHNNAIQAWRVAGDGSIHNVHL